MNADRAAFHRTIEASPQDVAPWLVYADWLEEGNGSTPDEHEYVRLCAEWREWDTANRCPATAFMVEMIQKLSYKFKDNPDPFAEGFCVPVFPTLYKGSLDKGSLEIVKGTEIIGWKLTRETGKISTEDCIRAHGSYNSKNFLGRERSEWYMRDVCWEVVNGKRKRKDKIKYRQELTILFRNHIRIRPAAEDTPLDYSSAENAGRRVAEMVEQVTLGNLTNNTPQGYTYGHSRILGLTNYPRNQTEFDFNLLYPPDAYASHLYKND